MTERELYSLYELKERLQGREICLKSDILSMEALIPALVTETYQAEFAGRLEILKEWAKENARLQEEIERIIKEAENDRE